MPSAKLTKSLVERLPQNEILWDTAIVGLGARRQTRGTFYVVRARVDGKQRMKSLGRHGHLTVEQARRLAQAALGQGDDPFVAEAVGQTFASLASRFLNRQRQRLRPKTLREITRHLRQASALGPKAVSEISRRDIAEQLAAVEAESGPYARNRLRSTLSAFFAFAISEGLVDLNPVSGTGKAAEATRDRVLSDDEIAAVWRALPAGDYGDVVRLLLLTGQRREEIGGLRWAEIDLTDRLITLPAQRCKNGRSHSVPLSQMAYDILAARHTLLSARVPHSPPINGQADVVFIHGDWTEKKAGLDKRLGPGFRHFVLHDCRRSVATGMAELGVAPHIIEACLNHVSGHKAGVAGTYNRATYEPEKRAALDAWAKHIGEAVLAPAGPPANGNAPALPAGLPVTSNA
jgi:integrase